MLFNKQVTEERVNEVREKWNELRDSWLPMQTNGFQLYKEAGNDWTKIDISKLKAIDWNESWADMPEKLKEYICSLPEFDSEIFKQITGLEAVKSLSGKEVKVVVDGKEYDAIIK